MFLPLRVECLCFHVHDGFLRTLKNRWILRLCVLLQALLRHDPHDFDNVFANLRDGNVDDLLSLLIGNSFLMDELDNLPSFSWNPWNWYGNDSLIHTI